MKYSINGTGNIVAERDIYSLGGFIPKGRVGGKIASEAQLSQDGDCWLAAGDISARPDVVIKDNAYIGDFVGTTGMHTDGVTEFSGNTLIPGKIVVRNLVADTKNNFFCKDSFIGMSMDVLCGSATGANFPFEQGRYNQDAPKGTLFTSGSMKKAEETYVRSTATLRLGKNTYVYTPVGFSARIYWAYVDATGQLAYAGESEVCSTKLCKLSHPVYKMCMISYVRGSALTPADLLATGAKIIGHINSSANINIRPESASGIYVMDKSSLLLTSDNFGLATTQQRLLAGGMYNTNMYTKTDVPEYKPYGTFRNVERLEYNKYLPDTHRTAATRDTYISAYDCPLLRVDDNTYDTSLTSTGDLTLRNCIVPKAEFQNDVVNGNTYEDLDFSYTNEDLGYTMKGYTRFISSHKQGIYRMSGGPSSTGFVSHKGNLADTARLYQAEEYIPLDGNIIEQGTYTAAIGQFYEEGKSGVVNTRIRTGKPVSTWGLVLPVIPSGYVLAAAHYLDEGFKFANSVASPTGIDTTYPYVVFVITKTGTGETALAAEFIALSPTLRIIDHSKAPEITGSAYVGAGCTVRGDVKLIGDPYVNRLLDVNMWERGGVAFSTGKQWLEMKDGRDPHARMSTKELFPVSPGDTLTLTGPYRLEILYFDSGKKGIINAGWNTGTITVPTGVSYVGFSFSSDPYGKLLEDSDIPLANVKYLRAFERRRYITNELDRTSPKDILIGPDYWEQGTAGGGQADAGKTYEELKAASGTTIRLKRPINVSPTSSISSASGFSRYIRVLDAVTKFRLGEPLNSAKMALLAVIIQKDPSAAIAPSEIPNSRLVLEFVPSPRIVVPYGSATLFISGPKIRMYDNAVLSRNLNREGEIVLRGDAVGGYDFNPGSCMCSNGHSDAIIKLP